MRKVLGKSFFDRSTPEVAEGLIGKYLVRRYRGKNIALMITETEAYDGFKDKASHAHRGQTPRNEVMFGEAGRWYVYFTYGMHWMLNIVTGPQKYPAAVLIRGVEGISGPARLTKKLKIDRKLNNKKANRKTGLWIEDREVRIKKSAISRTGRIGISYAGPYWAKKKFRFVLKQEMG